MSYPPIEFRGTGPSRLKLDNILNTAPPPTKQQIIRNFGITREAIMNHLDKDRLLIEAKGKPLGFSVVMEHYNYVVQNYGLLIAEHHDLAIHQMEIAIKNIYADFVPVKTEPQDFGFELAVFEKLKANIADFVKTLGN